MTDILEQLENPRNDGLLNDEAAEEIERLREDVERGVAHIELLFKWVVRSKGSIVENHTCWNARNYIETYRANATNAAKATREV